MVRPAFALVSERLIVRGIVGAVERMRPSPYESKAHAKLEDALRWIESRRDADAVARLRALLSDCEAQAGR